MLKAMQRPDFTVLLAWLSYVQTFQMSRLFQGLILNFKMSTHLYDSIYMPDIHLSIIIN